MSDQKTSFYLTTIARRVANYSTGTLGEDDYRMAIFEDTRTTLDTTNKIPGLNREGKWKITRHAHFQFERSVEYKDAGQSLLPYFDGTPITFNIPSPLGGIELFHYTNDVNYAGYIRPNLISFDYKKVFVNDEEQDSSIEDERINIRY